MPYGITSRLFKIKKHKHRIIMKKTLYPILLFLSISPFASGDLGYQDTPLIPGTKWHVHDGERPQPQKVTPGNCETPPSDAIILFDGKNMDAWTNQEWTLQDGYMEVKHKTGSQTTKQSFGDVQLHIEWNAPQGDGQHGSNSGVFMMGFYEIQIGDFYENKTYPDGQAGAVYGQNPPLVNSSRKPREWQSYDIIFTAPVFDGETLKSPAYITVFHNGVLVQNHFELIGRTIHKQVGTYKAHPPKAPISLQDHGDPIRFRNIWVREI
jgi:hypothetical protein